MGVMFMQLPNALLLGMSISFSLQPGLAVSTCTKHFCNASPLWYLLQMALSNPSNYTMLVLHKPKLHPSILTGVEGEVCGQKVDISFLRNRNSARKFHSERFSAEDTTLWLSKTEVLVEPSYLPPTHVEGSSHPTISSFTCNFSEHCWEWATKDRPGHKLQRRCQFPWQHRTYVSQVVAIEWLDYHPGYVHI